MDVAMSRGRRSPGRTASRRSAASSGTGSLTRGTPSPAAVILAGGMGSRLWPLARLGSPKPFLPLDRGVSLFRRTYERIVPLVGPSRVLVVTGAADLIRVRRQAPEVPRQNILTEAMSRDTAAAIGLAAHWLRSRHGDAIMVILPADHAIRPAAAFRSAIRPAIRAAGGGRRLVALGGP